MADGTKFRYLLTVFLTVLLGVLVVGGLLLGAQPASADSGPTISPSACMQTVFSGQTAEPIPNSDLLNCTANDIRLSRAISVSPGSCIQGETFTLTATFETNVTANTRYDAGFFFNIDGGANARLGTCSLSVLTPGSQPGVLQLDGDSCGDLNAGTINLTFTIPDVLCQDSDGDGFLNLPNCTSWHSNAGTVCQQATAGTFNAANAAPDTKSKCVCDDTFQVPVIVETATLDVEKSAAPMTVPETGGTVTYTVMVTNTAAFVSVTIDSIVDDIYGNLGTNTPAQANNTCPTLIGTVLAPGGSASCTFDAFVSGNSGDTVTDKATVCGTDSAGHTGICGDDTADVHITDVFTAPSLTKSAQTAVNCQLDVTYQVVVSNNSTIDTLTVKSLTDNKFGVITVAHPAGGGFEEVVTACTLSQNPIPPSGNANCTFTGRITSATCSFTHTDNVTADVTDSDGVNTPSVTDPDGGASVSVSTTIIP